MLSQLSGKWVCQLFSAPRPSPTFCTEDEAVTSMSPSCFLQNVIIVAFTSLLRWQNHCRGKALARSIKHCHHRARPILLTMFFRSVHESSIVSKSRQTILRSRQGFLPIDPATRHRAPCPAATSSGRIAPVVEGVNEPEPVQIVTVTRSPLRILSARDLETVMRQVRRRSARASMKLAIADPTFGGHVGFWGSGTSPDRWNLRMRLAI
jgi:hypothetical protein